MNMKTRVLVVDDEESIRKLLKSRLERDGFDVISASNADEAEKHFASGVTIGVVVTDVKMPGRDGFELSLECLIAKAIGKVACQVNLFAEISVGAEIKTQAITFMQVVAHPIEPRADLIVAHVPVSRTNEVDPFAVGLEAGRFHQGVCHLVDGLLIAIQGLVSIARPETVRSVHGNLRHDHGFRQSFFIQLLDHGGVVDLDIPIGGGFSTDEAD